MEKNKIKKENVIKNENMIKFESLVEKTQKIDIDDEKFKKVMFLYSSALKEIETRIEIIKEEFKYLYNYDLIDHTKIRIKEPKSIINKMQRKKYDLTYENLIENINDIAGIRVVCQYKNDIFAIKKLIEKIPGIKVLKEKDYINNPKKSGYESYHLILDVPVNLLEKIIYVKVEVQIRTIVMDFWANVEHKVKYKPEKIVTNQVSKELVSCAKKLGKIDNKITSLTT